MNLLQTLPTSPHRGAYRPDIDGLRAFAVLAVLLFHFDIPPFSGGFVGVDVFFVISGYLITSIVERERLRGDFSLLAFYERRLRRILPALLLVVVVSTVLSLFVMLPGDLRPAGTSLVYASLQTSNLYFYSVSNDYFAADNLTLSPALHTWSLGVEAQFYLLYPWVLVGLCRARARAVVLATLAALSFAAAAWGALHAESAAFYLLPWRAWELLLGAGVALRESAGSPRPRLARAQGIAGLVLVSLGVFVLSRATLFPGAAALLPCCGAALVIEAGRQNPVGLVPRLLSAPPLVFLGRISYSLYLWHWPLIVFANYGRGSGLALAERLALMLLSVALAMLSWWFVERPVIARRVLPDRRALFAAAAAATTVAVVAAGVLEQAGHYGFAPQTLPADVMTLAQGQYDAITGECRPDAVDRATAPPCRFGAPDRPATVLLWGNSYGRMWTPTLDLDAKAQGVAGVSLVLSKCLPLLGVAFPRLPGCQAFNDGALAYLRAHPALRTVILAANWFVAGPQLAELDKGLDALTGLGVKTVVVMAPPQPAFRVPRTLAMAALRHEPPPAPINQAAALAAQADSRAVIGKLQARSGFTIVDPFERLCDGTSCPLEIDGHPVFFDAGHISVDAARRAAGLFEPGLTP